MSEDKNIPKKFYNTLTEKPFEECLSCGTSLLEPEVRYVIEKAVKRFPDLDTEEVIFEYAMCLNCAQSLRENLSKDSRERIDLYMRERMLEVTRNFREYQEQGDPEASIKNCIITGKGIGSVMNYQLYAHCQGGKIIPDEGPFMISGQALEEIAELLSDKTRDELDDFINNNFGLPPEYADLIKGRDLVLF